MAAPNILCDTAGMTNAQWLAARMPGPSGKIPYTDETSGKRQRQSA